MKSKVLYHHPHPSKPQRTSFFNTHIFYLVMMDSAFISCWGFALHLWAIVSIAFPVFSRLQQIVKEKNDIISESGLEADGRNDAFASLPRCVKVTDTEHPALHSGGDVVIGGVFPLHYSASVPPQTYTNKPELITCSG